uniref:S1 self-incompatibility ribonuclease n=1 Tax=Petunia hybrida TaxID=4102 RepID=Q40874_PETHY|nr:S1 self-incompatibility ribonuclease precursor [Petunia x hybrida]prf//2106422A S1 RNase [Petunia x hybrida]
MFKLQLASVLCVFLFACSPISGSFDHWQLVLTWPAGYCKVKGCPRPVIPNDFTIHGLWPDSISVIMNNCDPTKTFVTITEINQITELEKRWPELTTTAQFALTSQSFWRYQYEKHGTCCFPVYSQSAYFDFAIKLKDKTDLLSILRSQGVTPGSTYTGERINSSIASVTRVKPNLKCLYYRGKLELTEIGICFDRTTVAMMSCPRISTSCKFGTNARITFRQ